MAHTSFRRSLVEQQQLWLIVEWTQEFIVNGEVYGLTCSDNLSEKYQLKDLHTGKKVSVVEDGVLKKASIVIVSSDKSFLEMEIQHLKEVTEQINLTKKVPTKNEHEKLSESEVEYYQSSESEWNPSSDNGSEDGAIKIKSNLVVKRKRVVSSTKSSSKKQVIKKNSTKRKNLPLPAISNSLQIVQNEHTHSNDFFFSQPKSYELANYGPSTSSANFDEIINNSTQRLLNRFVEAPSMDILPTVQVPPMTFDQQTQTNAIADENMFQKVVENQKILKTEMMNLYKAIDDIKNQIHKMQNISTVVNSVSKKYKEVVTSRKNKASTSKKSENAYAINKKLQKNVAVNNRVLKESNFFCSDNLNGNYSYNEILPDQQYGNNTSNSVQEERVIVEMIPIGSGKTEIPHHVFTQIRWNSYSHATRKLLTAVFPRRTLATHSLTGKASPAFSNRPAKLQLDAKKVSDIIITVTKMCNVPENLVRSAITTKCSDENKMFKIRLKRQKNKAFQNSDKNQENDFPDELFD